MADYKGRDDILAELQQRVEDKILEPSNYDLLKKLVENADTLDEAIKIAELGTTYRRTGFHFDKKLEKQSDTISYFKKNEELSFSSDPDARTHKLIVGDNYPALLNLLVEYKGKVDVIYIDPPYGKDSMGEFAQTNYENAISRDNLLSMLYPRLWLAKQLLTDTGVIYCSIDDRNQAYVKGLFDEVFGESNFVSTLVWRKRRGGGNDSTHVAVDHEYILVYANIKLNQGKWRVDYDESYLGRYKLEDEDGRYYWDTLSRPGLNNPIVYDVVCPDGTVITGGTWQLSKDTFEKKLKSGSIKFEKTKANKWSVSHKVYMPTGKVFRSVIDESKLGIIEDTTNKMAGDELHEIFGNKKEFDNPKPTQLVKRAISISTADKNAIVLDFFAGSGTTGQAVLELNKEDSGNRKFIVVTNNEVTSSSPNGIAYDVTSRRLKRVMTGEDYDGSKNFKWNEKNKPLGDNLLAVDISEVANFEATDGKTPFDVINETLYGQEKLSISEKIEWVAKNFEQTQKRLEAK